MKESSNLIIKIMISLTLVLIGIEIAIWQDILITITTSNNSALLLGKIEIATI